MSIKRLLTRARKGLERLPWAGIFWGNLVGWSMHCLAYFSDTDGIARWCQSLVGVEYFPIGPEVLGRIIHNSVGYGVAVWIALPLYSGLLGSAVFWIGRNLNERRKAREIGRS